MSPCCEHPDGEGACPNHAPRPPAFGPLLSTPAARDAAVKVLWDDRAMLPEHTEELVESVLAAAAGHFAGPGRAELIDALTAKSGYHGVVLQPGEAHRVITALLGAPR